MPAKFKVVETEEEWQGARAIRSEIFAVGMGFGDEVEFDAEDDKPTTVHFIGRDTDSNEIVAVSRALVDPVKRQARLGRVAVLPAYRGKGYGTQIVRFMEEQVGPQVDSFLLSAVKEKMSFYDGMGYHQEGNIYFLDGIYQCYMIKEIVAR